MVAAFWFWLRFNYPTLIAFNYLFYIVFPNPADGFRKLRVQVALMSKANAIHLFVFANECT
jgi:hypothetical protein